jgi:hypothetical protein
MHRIYEHESFLYPALSQTCFHIRHDIDEPPAGGYVKPEFFSVGSHGFFSWQVLLIIPECSSGRFSFPVGIGVVQEIQIQIERY